MSLVQEDITSRLLLTLKNYVQLLISMIWERDHIISKKNEVILELNDVIDSLNNAIALQNGIIAVLKDEF
jgi:hypothetical protein